MVGVIVLAAYRPSKELFARQLASIRDQTVTDWECICLLYTSPSPRDS